MAIKQSIRIIFCFFLLFSFTLYGCSAKKEIVYQDKVVEVSVPVIQKPEFVRPSQPTLYTKKLTKNSTPKQIVEAYYNENKSLKIYIKKLETLVSPFYKKEDIKNNEK